MYGGIKFRSNHSPEFLYERKFNIGIDYIGNDY